MNCITKLLVLGDIMTEFVVEYNLHGRVYRSKIMTDTSGSALFWVVNAFPEAKDMKIVSE